MELRRRAAGPAAEYMHEDKDEGVNVCEHVKACQASWWATPSSAVRLQIGARCTQRADQSEAAIQRVGQSEAAIQRADQSEAAIQRVD